MPLKHIEKKILTLCNYLPIGIEYRTLLEEILSSRIPQVAVSSELHSDATIVIYILSDQRLNTHMAIARVTYTGAKKLTR
jgi:hypothetical protein